MGSAALAKPIAGKTTMVKCMEIARVLRERQRLYLYCLDSFSGKMLPH